MSRIFIISSLLLLCSLGVQAQRPSKKSIKKGEKTEAVVEQLKIKTPTTCHAALISVADLGGDISNWWDQWHKIKTAKTYKETPCSFTNLKAGDYVLVVYNPASVSFDPNNGNPDEVSDGVVLEQLTIAKNSKLSYDFQKADFVDWNCLSCPWLYAFDGKEYIRLTEVIKDVVGEESCQTTKHVIDTKFVLNGKLTLRIQEEKEETSYLDRVSLTIDGQQILPSKTDLCQEDKKFLILEKGDFVELEFDLSQLTETSEVVLECNGYYLPKKEFLEAIYHKYMYKRN